MTKPNWREWKHTPDVTVWQACALSLDMEPTSMAPEMRKMNAYPTEGPFFASFTFPSKQVEAEFLLRERLLLANRSNHVLFPTRFRDRWQRSLRTGNSLVRLSEFASWAVSVVMWEDLPGEIVELADGSSRPGLSPPPILLTPINDRHALLRLRKTVTIEEAAEMLVGKSGWSKEIRAAIALIREAIEHGELEPESVHYWDEDAWSFDASRAVIDQHVTTITLTNFDSWQASMQATEIHTTEMSKQGHAAQELVDENCAAVPADICPDALRQTLADSANTPDTIRSGLTENTAEADPSDWITQARTIADKCFEHDTRNNCRDSLDNYSRRVMEEMQERGIHGPRGRIDNHKTVQRDALQGEKWWKHKRK